MDKNYNLLKSKAIILRKNGLGYRTIAKHLGVAKSTISLWLHDIQITPEQIKKLNSDRAIHLNTGPYSQRARREVEIKNILTQASLEIEKPISFETYRLFGAALYWAEGNKVSDFVITNSDPLLISFMSQWFCKIFKITPNDLSAHLNIYSGQDEQQLKKFWSDMTKIPLANFGKSFIKPPNKNYKKNTLYYGTIKMRVKRGTDFRYKVFGWINSILKNEKIGNPSHPHPFSKPSSRISLFSRHEHGQENR